MEPEAVVAVAELALPLGRVMRPDYVTTWLCTAGVEAFGGERPIDLIAGGDIDRVGQVVSGSKIRAPRSPRPKPAVRPRRHAAETPTSTAGRGLHPFYQ
jgi:hypothetical protein